MTKPIDTKQLLFALFSAVTLLFAATTLANASGFVHGIVIKVDGEDYYLLGPADGPNGERDLPGHEWVKSGPKGLLGKHYNTGPFGAPQWWSSTAPDGELLYVVKGEIDTWTEEKAVDYAASGFMHYHELVRVSDGALHPDKVVWLRHIARTTFTLDGGPAPQFAHEVSPGIDFEFIPNGLIPYSP
jgi:selenium-binding protein 1